MILFSVSLLLFSCRKHTVSTDPAAETMRTILQTQISEKDLGAVDFSSVRTAKLPNGHTVYLAVMQKENIILDVDGKGSFVKGNIYSVSGSVSKVKGAPKFSGVFTRSSLQRGQTVHYSIDNGIVKELHTFTGVSVNSIGGGQRLNYECADCTLPEVVVSSSYSSGGISWSTWMSLLAMFDIGTQYDYLAYDFSGGGGGGGGGGSAPQAPVIIIDQENAENKEKMEPKKYTDCFAAVPDNSTTLYTVTISSDLPTDGHPEIFYNWSDGSPGHAFIELNKSTPYGGVSQGFGFYPKSSYKLVTLDNINLPSKIVDDGGHEYQARYTISVTAAQFQAAINAVNSARDSYNVGLYNCTDFALDVFNAAGGGLTIPRHSIPGFEVDGGSNTPQGLYEKIQSMKNNGAANTTTTNNKEHAGSSKGPCD